MSGYPFFIPGFVLCTNSSLFWFKIANKLSKFRNYLYNVIIHYCVSNVKHYLFLCAKYPHVFFILFDICWQACKLNA